MSAADDRALEECEEAMAEADRDDLRAVLLLRFGSVPDDMEEKIAALRDIEQTNRLMLVAANALDLAAFRAEFASEPPAFRILSDAFETNKPANG